MNKAIFFDRDGVLNDLVERDGGFYSPRSLDEFHIKPEAKQVIELAKSLGYLCIVISNQPDISRGLMSQSELDQMTELMFRELELDDVFYCTSDDTNDTGYRKPGPGMFFEARDRWNVDLSSCYMIGDTWKDVEAAKKAGVKTILLSADYNLDLKADSRIDYLIDILSFIES